MTWLGSIAIAVVLALGGALLGGFIASQAVRWHHVSTREGHAGYFVVLLALLAGLFSFATGLLVAHYAGFESDLLSIACAAAVVFGALVLAGLVAWLTGDPATRRRGPLLLFDFELRTPANAASPGKDAEDFHATLSTGRGRVESVGLDYAGLRQIEGRWVLPGQFRLRGNRPNPYLAIGGRRLNGATAYFALEGSAGSERQASQWSVWLSALPSGDLQPESDAAGFELRLRLSPDAGGEV